MPLPGLARPKHGAAATFFDRSIQLRAARLLEICRRIMKGRPSNAEMAFMVLDCGSLLHIPPSFPPSGVGVVQSDDSASESSLCCSLARGLSPEGSDPYSAERTPFVRLSNLSASQPNRKAIANHSR